MSSRIRALFAVGAMTFSLGAATVAGADANGSGMFGRNLVVNGGAEADVGAPSNVQVVKPTGWTTAGEFTAVQYGASGGFPDQTSPGPKDRGKNLFEGGNVALSTATQTISLAAAASQIQAGGVRYAFSAWLGGYSSQGDNAIASVTFRDSRGLALGGTSLGPVTPAQRDGVTGLLARGHSGTVPMRAAKAVVSLVLTRTDGTYNDGSIDSVSLILSPR